MKKIISVALSLVLLCSLLVSCNRSGDAPDGMKLASGEKADYYLYIPEDWVIDLQTGATTAHVSSTDLSNVTASSWTLEYSDDTVDTWHERELEGLNAGFDDYKEESVRETTLDGAYAKEYVFTAKLGGKDRKYRQIAAIKGTSVYAITYSTTPELYDEHNDEADDIFAQFRFR